MNRELLKQTLPLLGLRVPAAQCGSFRSKLDGYLINKPRIKCIVDDSDSQDHKVVLLREDITNVSQLPEDIKGFLETHPIEITNKSVEIGAAQMSTEQILKKLLPPHDETPSSFETIGHIAHLNIRDELLPYKNIIGEVLLEKNPKLKTVVNKVGKIETTFRTFQMEVIAGENNLETQVKESGCLFKFNFAEVYWNSRLQTEHGRLISLLKKSDIVCDMFAGVGPFSVPAAKSGTTVYANDLNPRSYHYLVQNRQLNKIPESRLKCFNLDARAFARQMIDSNPPPSITHIFMNLPASAVEFLDVFKGVWLASNPTVHCYGFSSAEDPHSDIIKQVTTYLGRAPLSPSIHEVRDVAPKKVMMCVSFKLPYKEGEVLESSENDSLKRKAETIEESQDKKQKQESSA